MDFSFTFNISIVSHIYGKKRQQTYFSAALSTLSAAGAVYWQNPSPLLVHKTVYEYKAVAAGGGVYRRIAWVDRCMLRLQPEFK